MLLKIWVSLINSSITSEVIDKFIFFKKYGILRYNLD